jgi:hypothetical protein
MKIEINTDFVVPIWRFFYSSPYKIPYTFELHNKKYNNWICIIQIGCFVSEITLKYTSYMNEKEINLYYGSNHIICIPNMEIYNIFKKYRPTLNLCLANHNAFIDETFYNIDNSQKIIYDLFVSSQFLDCKNLNLLENIDNICGMGYYPCSENEKACVPFPSSVKKVLNFKDGVERVQKNWNWIEPVESIKTINSSKIGGIFSTMEGACFSSSEYLLCGIPVLSCTCKGGRDIWYDDKNSELCDPTNSSIQETLKRMLIKYDNGEYNRESIRNNHIKKMKIHRNNLSNAVLNIMKKIIAPDNLPSLEELTESLKHYHSNNRCYEYIPSYKRQYEREKLAIKVLK